MRSNYQYGFEIDYLIDLKEVETQFMELSGKILLERPTTP
jgi:hypothetical protein